MTKPRKIAVSKQLPTQSGLYSAFTDESVNVKAWYYITSKKWFAMITRTNITKLVTHWTEKERPLTSKPYSIWLITRLNIKEKLKFIN